MSRRILFASLVALSVAGAAFAQDPPAAKEQAATAKPAEKDTGWNVMIYPVLAYVPVAGIDINLPPQPPCTTCPPETPTASGDTGLSGAWFANLRVEKGRVAVEAAANYAGLKAERSTPFLNLKVQLINGSIVGGFKIVEGLYAEAGAKYHELDITARILSFSQVSWKPNVWRPVIGATYRPDLTKRIRLVTHLDYTGFGGDAFSSVNGQARVELQPIRHFVLAAGYGFSHLVVNGEIQSKPVHLDYTLHGPVLGFGFVF